MKTLLRASLLSFTFATILVLTGCAGKQIERSKWTDKNFRVMIDPVGLDANQYARLQQALVQTDHFVVVDRARGLNAIRREQENLHRQDVDRYEDQEKWALWGKLYGVGAVVVAQSQCYKVTHVWDASKTKSRCQQFVSMIDANTGVVIASASGESDSAATMDSYAQLSPDWEDVVEDLVKRYPKYFENKSYAKPLETYRGIAQEEATRQKEVILNGR